MTCNNETRKSGTDALELGGETRPFDVSATAWLMGQGVHYLNNADKESELAYQRIVELLRRCGKDIQETSAGLYQQINQGDAALRWNLLYLMGDVGKADAADFLTGIALTKLPEATPDQGCEGARDMEMLVSTMAIHALHRISTRQPEVSESLLKIVAARPERPILVEAVKVSVELGLKDKLHDLLDKDSHWMLDLRRARAEELVAEPEREDGKERGFTPPKSATLSTSPNSLCCQRKEN